MVSPTIFTSHEPTTGSSVPAAFQLRSVTLGKLLSITFGRRNGGGSGAGPSIAYGSFAGATTYTYSSGSLPVFATLWRLVGWI